MAKKYQDKESVPLKNILVTIGIIIFLAIVHESHEEEKGQKVQKFLIAFKEGKTIICKDKYKITKYDYNFESGTMVFINKKITDIRYSIDECKLGE